MASNISRMSLSRTFLLKEDSAPLAESKMAIKADFFAASPQVMMEPLIAVSEAAPLVKANTINPNLIRFLDIEISKDISDIRIPAEGVSRDQITVPISPNPVVNDEMLFEDPKEGGANFYLPRYRISEENTSSGQQYRISLEKAGNIWKLVIHLAKYPASSIEIASRQAKEIPHQIAVILKYQLKASGGVQKEMIFEEVTIESAGIRAELNLGSLEERDELYRAITKPEYSSQLTVRRAIRVALLVAAGGPNRPRVIRDHRRRVEPDDFVATAAGSVRPEIVRDHRASMKHLLASSAVMENSGIEAASIWLPEPQPSPQQPLFREVTRALDSLIDPFLFDPELHKYIFHGISPITHEAQGLIPIVIPYQNPKSKVLESHNYYQEEARRQVFYYLPDSFKIGRRSESPHTPIMSVGFPSPDQVLLKYFAMPYINPDRLDAAAGKLQEFLKTSGSEALDRIELQPLIVNPEKIQFRMELPLNDGSSDPHQQRNAVSLRSGITGNITMSVADFQQVFDALFAGPEDLIFQGSARAEIFENQIEVVDFIARMNDLAGDLLDYTEMQGESGGIIAAFKNAIESPLRIKDLKGWLRRGESASTGSEIKGAAFPILLNPGEEAKFTVSPTAPIAGSGDVHAVYNLDFVEVLADKESIWDSIIDKNLSTQPRTITVKTFLFKNPEALKRVLALIVDFETGESVELAPDKDTANVTLDLPAKDRILRKADSGTYKYVVTTIGADSKESQSQWKTGSSDLLRVTEAN